MRKVPDLTYHMSQEEAEKRLYAIEESTRNAEISWSIIDSKEDCESYMFYNDDDDSYALLTYDNIDNFEFYITDGKGGYYSFEDSKYLSDIYNIYNWMVLDMSDSEDYLKDEEALEEFILDKNYNAEYLM